MIKVAQQVLCGPCCFITTTKFFESSVRCYICYFVKKICIPHTHTHTHIKLCHITCMHLFH